MLANPAMSSSRSSRRRFWLVPLLSFIMAVYAFYGSAGTFTNWPVYTSSYDLLADGFRNGHLHLSVSPSPQLLARVNPYDPQHWSLWFVDISLYNGQYYLYWGPLPALIQAAAKAALGINRVIGDQYLVFSFLSLAAVFGALLIERVASRIFSSVPRWLVALGTLTLAFANPILYLASTAAVYQVAITGGQAFLLGGLLFAYDAVSVRAGDAFRRRSLLVTGTLLSLSLACRISLGPCIALIAGATLLAGRQLDNAWLRRSSIDGIFLGLPLLTCFAALLAYNHARFDEWLEFGTTHQLSTLKFHLSSAYWSTNLYAYMLTPYELSCRFPYLLQNWSEGPKGLPNWFELPAGYYVQEPVAGWLVTAPITWLSPVPVITALGTLRRRDERQWRGLAFIVASCVCLGSVAGMAVMGLYMATMRYLADVTYGLVLLGLLGGFTLVSVQRLAGRRKRRGIIAAFTLLATLTIVTGLLLGVQGYTRHFKEFNPVRYSKLVKALSVCER
jgi:hypothetical protein